MLKKLINLCAASASFIVFLLLANTNIVIPELTNSISQATVQPMLQQVSLNVANPELGLINHRENILLEHSGCSCSLCTQSVNDSSFDV